MIYLMDKTRRWLVVISLALVVVGYFINAYGRSILNSTHAGTLPVHLEREDWNIYPIGCYLIQLPASYTILADHSQSFGSSYYIIPTPSPKENWIDSLDKSQNIRFTMGVFEGIPREVIEMASDVHGMDTSVTRRNGVRYRSYFENTGKEEDEDSKVLAGILVEPPIPRDGTLSIFIGDFISTSEEKALLSEIARTVRVDQRHFGTMTAADDAAHPLDSIDWYHGAYIMPHFTVEEFRSFDGEMDRTPHLRVDEMTCDQPKVGRPAPILYIEDTGHDWRR